MNRRNRFQYIIFTLNVLIFIGLTLIAIAATYAIIIEASPAP